MQQFYGIHYSAGDNLDFLNIAPHGNRCHLMHVPWPAQNKLVSASHFIIAVCPDHEKHAYNWYHLEKCQDLSVNRALSVRRVSSSLVRVEAQ